MIVHLYQITFIYWSNIS